MKNLENAVSECKRDIEALGIELGSIISITINNRAKSRWGRCTRVDGAYKTAYKIEISGRLLDDEVDDMALKDTIVHELLHTIKGGFGHTGAWKRAAELMNARYGYHVKRTTTCEEKGIKQKINHPKYVIKCNKCGNLNYFYRKTKTVDRFLTNPERATYWYNCGICKAHKLELIKHS